MIKVVEASRYAIGYFAKRETLFIINILIKAKF